MGRSLSTYAMALATVAGASVQCADPAGPIPDSAAVHAVPMRASVDDPEVHALRVTATEAGRPLGEPRSMPVRGGVAAGSIPLPRAADRIRIEGLGVHGAATHVAEASAEAIRTQTSTMLVAAKKPRGTGPSGRLPIQVILGSYHIEVKAQRGAGEVRSGRSVRFLATVTGAEGAEIEEVPVRWATLNPAIALVDERGMVSGVSAGSTLIVATFAGVGGAAEIRVSPSN